MNQPLSPALFLDRDGTLHKDSGFLARFEDFQVIEGVEEALHLAQKKGYRLFGVSNQSGVARGYFPLETVRNLNEKIQEFFRLRGINLEEIAFCPHHPEGKVEPFNRECECRKPKPGMLLDLANRYGLDLGRSFMAGDNLRDAEAGRRAGTVGVLIRPGNGIECLDKAGLIKEFDSLLVFVGTLPTL